MATYLRCGDVFNNQLKKGCIAESLSKTFLKSVNIWQSFKQERNCLNFIFSGFYGADSLSFGYTQREIMHCYNVAPSLTSDMPKYTACREWHSSSITAASSMQHRESFCSGFCSACCAAEHNGENGYQKSLSLINNPRHLLEQVPVMGKSKSRFDLNRGFAQPGNSI